LNVVPPVSKEIALGPVIAAEKIVKTGKADTDKVTNLPTQMAHASAAAPAPVAHKVKSEEIVAAVPPRETRTQRVRRLQEEARALAREQIGEFELLLDATAKMALEIADGGEVYSIGAREICRRLADELPRTLQTLHVISRKN
jgi:hypothetical protein